MPVSQPIRPLAAKAPEELISIPGSAEEAKSRTGSPGSHEVNFSQVALPALALSVFSVLAGWALRGLEGRSRGGEASQDALSTADRIDTTHSEAQLAAEGSTDESAKEQNSQLPPAPNPDTGVQGQPTNSVSLDEGHSSCSESEPASTPAANGVPPLAVLVSRVPSSSEPAGSRGVSEPAQAAATSASFIRDKQLSPHEASSPERSEATGEDAPATPSHGSIERKIAAAVTHIGEGESPGWLRRTDGRTRGSVRQRGHSAKAAGGLEAVDDMTLIMAALAERLCIDVDRLKPQERMQLLQMALQCCQHRENSW